ncbi:MAG TPA: lipid-A-disaccharide synthase, partial [Halanaerobiales bacterium]|nr:lipid-A-disaccharide synthase [Halanaerobiales bacterium]
MGKVLVVTGEVSGDMHAARVVREIKALAPRTEIDAVGSDYLKKEGAKIIIDPTKISTIGFSEAFKNLRKHLQNLKYLKGYIKKSRPDVLFLVDNSGFNMLMARLGRKKRIPVVNYFSPSAWVWGEWRARWMAHYRAAIASVFPMEADVYQKAGARVEFVGHPLLDIIKNEKEIAEIYSRLELQSDRPVIALLPGSREQEIDRLLPAMLQTAVKLQEEQPGLQFVLPVASGIDSSQISKIASRYKIILKLVENSAREVMKVSELLLTASGTATLEAAIIGTPMIIAYQVNPLSYRLGKRLLKQEFIGLPNIIAGREIVPELVQDRANLEEMYRTARRLLSETGALKEIRKELV